MQNDTWQNHLLFPTRVLINETCDCSMLASIQSIIENDPRFKQKNYAEIADIEGLNDLLEQEAFKQLKQHLIDGLKAWLKLENITGDYTLVTHLFSNYAPAGDFVPAHNHIASISGVFYVRVPDFSDKPILYQGNSKDYWRMDKGVLILHDPAFNASLSGMSEQNYAKVFPREGMTILFPSYLWHSVTPHDSENARIAIAVNFELIEKSANSKASREDLSV